MMSRTPSSRSRPTFFSNTDSVAASVGCTDMRTYGTPRRATSANIPAPSRLSMPSSDVTPPSLTSLMMSAPNSSTAMRATAGRNVSTERRTSG